MAYLIDSDWTIDHLAEVPAASQLVAKLTTDGAFISIVTYMEAFQGTLRQADPPAAAFKLREMASSVPVLPLSIPIAERSARLRQHFLDIGQRPMRRGFDILIAATAIEHGLTLVTRNIDDYADIPGIELYQPAEA